MKYLVDAQLPKRLKIWLTSQGVDAIHTLDLPKQNYTSDAEIINEYATLETVVITKDKDFPHQRLIKKKPKRLLWVTTGNIVNNDLIRLFEANFAEINKAFEQGDLFLEMDNKSITVHE